MTETLKFYFVDDHYIDYLYQFDKKVPFNKKGCRPYVGIILENNGMKYFAPCASPKPKHLHMRESITYFRIDNGNLGIVNLNNMIPINISDVILINFDTQLPKYKTLLINQLTYIRDHKAELFTKANKLYNIVKSNYSPKLSRICCDYSMLEEKCHNWLLIKNEIAVPKKQVASLKGSNLTK